MKTPPLQPVPVSHPRGQLGVCGLKQTSEIKALSAPGELTGWWAGGGQWALLHLSNWQPASRVELALLPLVGGQGVRGALSELCGLSYGPNYVGRWRQEGAPGPPHWLRAPGHNPGMLQGLRLGGGAYLFSL